VDTCITRLRSSATVGRVGGEDFAIMLPHTKAEIALEVAERPRIAVEGREISAACAAAL
jgi:GGDEF domain-containing protein